MCALLVAALGYGLFLWVSESSVEIRNFSEFQEIPPSLFETAKRPKLFAVSELQSRDSIRSVFTEDSKEVLVDKLKAEKEYLLSLKEKRTPAVVSEYTEEQANAFAVRVGGKTLGTYLNQEEKPLTYKLYEEIWHDVESVVAEEKIALDVQRPMQYSLEIDSPVESKNTPSVPSEFAAETAVILELIRLFANSKDISAAEQAVKEAQEREHIVGVNSRAGTNYANTLAKEYVVRAIARREGLTEFTQVIKELEWSGIYTSAGRPRTKADLALFDPRFERSGQVFRLSTTVKNTGSEISPNNIKIKLELDRYGDGVVDEIKEFPFGSLAPGTSAEMSHIFSNPWPGEHLFRFVINPGIYFYETDHLNNYGQWTTLTN